ncbi:MAG: DUF6498-containing protein [Cytophagaceae bacterium]
MKISIPAPTDRQFTSVWVLILMNLVPVYGIMFSGWKAFDVVIIYVLETVIIGLFNIIKMSFGTVMTSGEKDAGSKMMVHLLKLFLIPFFIFHYFFFIAIQSLFVFTFLGDQSTVDFLEIPVTFRNLINSNTELFAAILSIFGSHSFSFLANYIGNKEYAKVGVVTMMIQPYIRIFIQQFVVVFGIILLSIFKTPDIFVLLLVFFKIIADAFMHLRIHRKYSS